MRGQPLTVINRLEVPARRENGFRQRVAEAGPAWDEFVRFYGRFDFIDDPSTDAHGRSAMHRGRR